LRAVLLRRVEVMNVKLMNIVAVVTFRSMVRLHFEETRMPLRSRATEVPTGLGIPTLLTFTRMDTGSAMITAVRTLVFTWIIRGRTVDLLLVSAPSIASGW
jgi:hypothetical protein